MMLFFKIMQENLLLKVPTCLNLDSQVPCSSSHSLRFSVKLRALKYKTSPLLFSIIMTLLSMPNCNKRLLFSNKFKNSKQSYNSNSKCTCSSCKTLNNMSLHMDCYLLILTNWSTFWWTRKKKLLCARHSKLWGGEWQEWQPIWKDRLFMHSLILTF